VTVVDTSLYLLTCVGDSPHVVGRETQRLTHSRHQVLLEVAEPHAEEDAPALLGDCREEEPEWQIEGGDDPGVVRTVFSPCSSVAYLQSVGHVHGKILLNVILCCSFLEFSNLNF